MQKMQGGVTRRWPPEIAAYSDRTVDYDVIKRVLAALEDERVRYVIFGAVALNFHGLARFTEDLDLFVSADADNIERL
jgi:hypothetical protein